MGERLDAAITNVQDFVLDRMGGVLTELEVADLQGRITLLVNESRFPFEMELVDMSHGVVITVPEQFSVEEVIEIKRSMAENIGPDIRLFVCRGNIKIQKFHADLVIAARRFVERCYACRGTGVVGQENETPMNCGVCADLRVALKFFDKHNIPQSQEKDTIPPKETVFQEKDPILWNALHAVFGWYVNEKSFGTNYPQSQCVIFLDKQPDQPVTAQTSDIEPWVHSSSSLSGEFVVRRFQKGDPLIHSTELTGEEDVTFGTYIDQHGTPCDTEQPRSVVFNLNPDNRHAITVLTKDLKPGVHSFSSMPPPPPAPPASQDTNVEIHEDGPMPK